MTRLGIAAESDGDVPVVSGLADRLLVEKIDWIEEETIDAFREWCGIQGENLA